MLALPPAPVPTVSVETNIASLEREWRTLEATGTSSVYQRYEWVSRWCEHVAPSLEVEPRFYVLSRQDEIVGILPLGLHYMGPVGILTNLSDSHTNFVGGVFCPTFSRSATADLMVSVRDAILEADQAAEGLSLCCIPGEWNGVPNPLRFWFSNDSAHDAWACDLSQGFDALLDAGSGKRKRKKHRHAARKFDDAGGWRVVRPETDAEATAMFAEACSLMATRFETAGIRDPFAPQEVRSFMRDTLARSIGNEAPTMSIWALEVSGERIAWQAGGISGSTLSLMFTVFDPTRYEKLGPGDFLLYEVLQDAAERGISQLDLGRGSEPYKLSWCNRRIPLSDARIGRTTRATILLSAHRQATALKKRVREDERLWAIAKRVRRLAA